MSIDAHTKDVSETTRRISVSRYRKSGRLIAGFRHKHYGVIVLELSSDLRTIEKFRQTKYIRQAALSRTDYFVEVKESLGVSEQNQGLISFRLIRVLTNTDIDPKKWMSTASLHDLPVSPDSDVTSEELLWAGKREGNLGGGYALVITTIAATAFAIYNYSFNSGFVFPLIVAMISGFFLFRYEWKHPVSPDAIKLEELETHKRQMRLRTESDRSAAITQFQLSLKTFDTWRSLSPEQFEMALSLRLKDEGFEVKKMRHSKDGGVDIEAIDRSKKPMIVQAKKYAANVGVNVIREMIGVRECRTDKPRTMVYSLSGFTRGAKELASAQGVELRDIKTELLKV
jgi:hypothetical protein